MVLYICDVNFHANVASLWEAFSGIRFVGCAPTPPYSTYITVGWFIASIQPRRYIYLGLYISAIDLSTEL